MNILGDVLKMTSNEIKDRLDTIRTLKHSVQVFHSAYSYYLMGGKFQLDWYKPATQFNNNLEVDSLTTKTIIEYNSQRDMADRQYENEGEIVISSIVGLNNKINKINAELTVTLSPVYSLTPLKLREEDYLILLQYYKATEGVNND